MGMLSTVRGNAKGKGPLHLDGKGATVLHQREERVPSILKEGKPFLPAKTLGANEGKKKDRNCLLSWERVFCNQTSQCLCWAVPDEKRRRAVQKGKLPCFTGERTVAFGKKLIDESSACRRFTERGRG